MPNVRMAVERRVRRAVSNPFAGERAVLVHVAHHKVGTVWFNRILDAMAHRYGLRYRTVGNRSPFAPGADVYQFLHSRHFDRSKLAGVPFRGSHLVRDPRDVAVSAYHYHLWTPEAWVHLPSDELGGRTYQQHLNELDVAEGLLVEIRRSCHVTIDDMGRWDYDQPEFLELHYEELIADEAGTFARLFEHWGLNERAAALGRDIVEEMSFKNQAGRQVGEQGERGERSHLRSGRPGEWRTMFGPEHVALFKELAGDTLIKLGYERDGDWGV